MSVRSVHVLMLTSNRDILGQLLGSTNKAEVLEAIEFFRVAWEYQFDNAEVWIPCSVDGDSSEYFLSHSQGSRKCCI